MYKNLITAQEVIKIAFTNSATDPALIKDDIINIAQEEHIRPALGYTSKLSESLYESILQQNADCILTDDNATLLNDYIKPALAFCVKLEMLHDMNINTTSKGLMINQSDTSRAASVSEIQQFSNKVQSHASTLIDKMTRFLNDEDNIDNYPLYRDAIKQKADQKGGIIFDADYPQAFTDYPNRLT